MPANAKEVATASARVVLIATVNKCDNGGKWEKFTMEATNAAHNIARHADVNFLNLKISGILSLLTTQLQRYF